MSVQVHLHVIDTAMAEFLHGPTSPIVHWVVEKGTEVRNAAVRRAPRDTGLLASTIELIIQHHGNVITGLVGSRLEYAIWQHEGTGIYAGKDRIRPVSKKALKFQPRGGAGPARRGAKGSSPEARGFVFAKSVKGTPPNPFLVEALNEVFPGVAARLR